MDLKIKKKYRFRLKEGLSLEGRVMEKTKYNDNNSIIIKLNNGYNIAINKEDIEEIKEIVEKIKKEEQIDEKDNKVEYINELKSKVLILSTGGTIASKVEYETGAVVAASSPEEIIENFPFWYKLKNKLIYETILNEMSENFIPQDWEFIAKKTLEKYEKHKNNLRGIIITHGTDTMHYTSSALSFIIPYKINIPVVLVGSQRSSDRPSSDAITNLMAAIEFINSYSGKGVFVCMHSSISDDEFDIHSGTRVRKMHSSRRDAFKSINALPFAKILFDMNKKEFNVKILNRNNIPLNNKYDDISIKFSNDVVLVKYFPGMSREYLERVCENKKAVVLEGTGLGHVNIKELLEPIKKLTSEGKLVFMTTQTIYGGVHEYVYKNLRLLKDAGVVFLKDMISEVAYVKLCLALENFGKKEEIVEFMLTNVVGEIGESYSN